MSLLQATVSQGDAILVGCQLGSRDFSQAISSVLSRIPPNDSKLVRLPLLVVLSSAGCHPARGVGGVGRSCDGSCLVARLVIQMPWADPSTHSLAFFLTLQTYVVDQYLIHCASPLEPP